MHIRRLQLMNVCQHVVLDETFEMGLIALLGPLGSGKSNLVNSIYAGLTNDYSRFEGGKESVPRQRRGSDEASSIQLEAGHNETSFTVLRRLAPTAKHQLRIGDAPPLTKATEIQPQLEGLLGVDKNLLDKYVFVEQWGVRSLFNMTLAERSKALSRLCGTEWAEKCWEAVSRQIIVDTSLATASGVDLDDIRTRLAAARAKIDEAQGQLLDAQASLLTEREAAELDDRRFLFNRRKELATQLQAALRVEREAFEKAKTAVAAYKDLQQQHAAQAASMELRQAELTAELDSSSVYETRKRDWAAKQRLLERQLRLRQDLAAIVWPHSAEQHPGVLDEISQLLRQRDGLLAELAPHEALLKAQGSLASQAVCPTCKQALTDIKSAVEASRSAVEKLRPELSQVETREKTLQRQLAEYRQSESRQSQLNAELASLAERLLAAAEISDPDVGLVSPIRPLTTIRGEIAEVARRCRELDAQLASRDSQRASAVSVHQTHKQNVAGLRQQIDELGVPLENLDSLLADVISKLDRHREAQQRVAAIQAEAQLRGQILAQIEQELQQALASAENRKKAGRWLNALTRAGQILHRDNLPSRVHRYALQNMESRVNDVLTDFDSPFYVKASEDMSYTAYFRDGTVMPARGLSGGQQVTLSIAFRWVLNSLFAGQLGMMVLDEPTAGLDQRHIELLEQALTKIGQAAIEKHFQVLIITHEQRLERAFNQVIRLQKVTD